VHQVQRYLQRISGPLLDRIDIHIEVPRLQHEELLGKPQGEPSTVIRQRVVKARQIQQERFTKERGKLYANGAMQAGQIRRFCPVNSEVKELLRSAHPLRGYPAARPLGPRLRPDPEAVPHHRGPGGLTRDPGAARGGGAPASRVPGIARWTGGCWG
jgi:hypothetical protein